MRITSEQLKTWRACKEGYEWFLRRFPSHDAGYQEVLDALADDSFPDYAIWLMNRLGPCHDTEIEIESVSSRKHLFFAGSLIVKNGIAVDGQLLIGLDIDAGGDIHVGEGIRAGGNICAGGDIWAGGNVKTTGSVGAGGSIKVKGGINAVGSISAGRDIAVKGDIGTGRGIGAGGAIGAGGNIEVCRGFGIFAGQRIQPANWPRFARVEAKTKPDNLISGYWVDDFQPAQAANG